MKTSVLEPVRSHEELTDRRRAENHLGYFDDDQIEADFVESTDSLTGKTIDTTAHTAEMRSFRQLSKSAVNGESRWQLAFEATVLGLVVAIIAWPLISLLIVLAQTANG